MFMVDDASAEAIRRALHEDGEFAAVIELRRRFPGLADNAAARLHVRAIAGWTAQDDPLQPRSSAGQPSKP